MPDHDPEPSPGNARPADTCSSVSTAQPRNGGKRTNLSPMVPQRRAECSCTRSAGQEEAGMFSTDRGPQKTPRTACRSARGRTGRLSLRSGPGTAALSAVPLGPARAGVAAPGAQKGKKEMLEGEGEQRWSGKSRGRARAGACVWVQSCVWSYVCLCIRYMRVCTVCVYSCVWLHHAVESLGELKTEK